MTDIEKQIEELEETLQTDSSPIKTLEYLSVMSRRKKVNLSLDDLLKLTKEHDPYLRYMRLTGQIAWQ